MLSFDQQQQGYQLQKLRELQLQQTQQQIDQDALANTNKAKHDQQVQEAIARITGQGTPSAPDLDASRLEPGMMQPTAGAASFGSPLQLSPGQLQWAQANAQIDPEGTMKQLAEWSKPEAPKAAEAPIIKDFYEGGKVVQKQWNAQNGTWDKVGEGPRWEPNAGGAGEVWEPYVDPKSGRTGQRNKQSGKIDWDPGNTMMVQTGTDQNGNPIYDMVSTSAGKPPSEANIQAGIRGTLIEGSMKEIRKITSDLGAKISPLRMAAADTIGEKGPLGAYGANMLRTDDEKKYSASIAKGVEGLVAAITGAGVAMSQFPRIQQLIPGPTDGPEIVNWKLDQLEPLLNQLLAGSGPLALSGDKVPGGAAPAAPSSDGYTIEELP